MPQFASPNCYFAHHITDYNTSREADAIATIESAGFTVTNPNSPENEAAYRLGGMAHFLGVVATCKALAFLRFPDGQVGAGVSKEIATAASRALPIYEISGSQLYTIWPETVPSLVESALSVDDTRALLATLRAQS